MHYFMLFVWMTGLLLGGMGLYRLWTRWLGPSVVDWFLLPATLVGEGAYIVGRKICKRPAFGGIIGPKRANEDACRYAIAGQNGFLIEFFSEFLTLLAMGCAAAAMFYYLSDSLTSNGAVLWNGVKGQNTSLPGTLPGTWSRFWSFLSDQLDMARRVSGTWVDFDWTNWQNPALIYGSICAAVRLGPVRHDQRPLMLLVMALVGIAAAAGKMAPSFETWTKGEFWFVLSYLWAVMVLLAMATAGAMFVINFIRVLAHVPPKP
ncbi:MAG: hypothetical protein HN909_01150 [Phycisphaerales bacterium]|jgi:hypothetical protein|nr:hypothetical protein [Phycisphaerales bacterium]MBT7170356.1 hypothetical protein [Phycisphaerales bacterium]